MDAEAIEIQLPGSGRVSGLLARPDQASALFVLAHGAGAGMRHRFLEALAGELCARRIATLRYQFPFTEAGRRMPDRPPLLEATVRAATAEAARRAPDLPIVAGGKSMGGRMTSRACAESTLPGVCGLVFVGFPLHPARKPGIERAEHLARVELPMLFLQGTRDELADLALLRPVLAALGRRAELHVVDGADHSFAMPPRTRRPAEILGELADRIAAFATDAQRRSRFSR